MVAAIRNNEFGLTHRQYNFVSLILEGKSDTEAYMGAYKATSAQTAGSNARKLKKNTAIALALTKMQEKVQEKVLLTIEQHYQNLDRILKKSESEGEYKTALKAEELKGKLCGFYNEADRAAKDNTPHEITVTMKYVKSTIAIPEDERIVGSNRISFDD